MRIVDRYLLREMLPVYALAAGTFVVLIVGHMLYTVVEVVVERHVPLPSVGKFLALRVPQAVSMALPVSALIAAALCFNRLAADGELAALRAAGASLWRLMWPAVILGAVSSAVVFLLNEQIAPRCEEASRRLLIETVSQRRSLAFQPRRFLSLSDTAWVYPEDVDQRRDRLLGVSLFMLRGDDPPAMVSAEEAEFRQGELVVRRGHMLVPEWSGDLTIGHVGPVRVSLQPEAFALPGGAGALRQMSLQELARKWRSTRQTQPQRAALLSLEFHSRLAMAAAALAFALLAGPLTLVLGRGQTLAGIALSLFVVLAYYLLMLWFRLLGERGQLPPAAAAWGPNAVVLVLTAWLAFRSR